jgi:hypothetical protein
MEPLIVGKNEAMRKLLPLIAFSLFLGAASAQAAPVDREAELERALEGRVAGEPVDCINLNRIRGTRIIPDTAIVYEVGNVLYVNRPRAGARSLDRNDTLVSRPFSNRLCSVDTLQLLDMSSRMTHGVVFLGEFVPYRRADGRSAD